MSILHVIFICAYVSSPSVTFSKSEATLKFAILTQVLAVSLRSIFFLCPQQGRF